jgi:predicted CopG family antitoxin
VPVNQEVADRLEHMRFAGESISDVVIRLAAYAASGGKPN